MKAIYLLIVAFVFSVSGFAQNSIDLFSVSGGYGWPSSYEAPYSEKATEVQQHVAATIPIELSDKTIFFNNFNYYHFSLESNNEFGDAIANPADLHGFILRTGIVRKLNDKNKFQLFFIPRYMSDFNKSSETAWQFGGVAMFEHRYNKDLMMRYGLMYNAEFFGHYFIPVVHLDWNITEKVSVAGMLPIYMKIKYKYSDRLELGFSHLGLTTSYRLGGETYDGDYLVRQSIDLALYGRYHLGKNFHLETKVGMALGRQYDQFANDQKVDLSLPLVNIGDDRLIKSTPFDNGPFINLKLVYNYPLD
jgi:hypothetical protein